MKSKEGRVPSRETIQKSYVRVCKDSGFKLDYIRAAILAGLMLNISPIQVWVALGSFDVMERIASGLHPAAS